MALVANRRSVMTMFSDPTSAYSHQVRMVLAEKGITVDIIDIDPDPAKMPEDFHTINPDNTLPTLVDRDLVLYDAAVIMEYLDERFPHPPLMPVDPVSRARTRMSLHSIAKDWYILLDELEGKSEKAGAKIRKNLRDSLVRNTEAFTLKPFFLNDEFSLADCALAPLLWRLPSVGIELPAVAKPIEEYAERLYARASFAESMTEKETEMRD